MSEFKYIAITNTGERIEGNKVADNQSDVLDYIHSEGMTPVVIEERLGVNFKKLLSIEIGGLKLAEKVVLAKQLSTMISAGIPIIQAIDILVQQTEKESLKLKLQKIYKAIEAGTNLSDAFKREKGILSEVQLNLLAAGEKSGNLNEMLSKIAEDMEKSRNLRGKITGALIYPSIIFVVMIVVLIVMIVFMVPQVKQLYSSLGKSELPGITQFLVNIGSFFTNIPTLIGFFVLLFSLFLFYKYYTSSKEGRLKIDRIKLRIPVFGNLSQKIEIVEFCRVSAMLMTSGIPIIESLEIVSRAMGNSVFKEVLIRTKEELTKGSSLAISMAKNNIYNAFPLILIKMIATGEEAGRVDKVLLDLGQFYENEVDQIAANLTKLMEPFILVVVGVMVGFMAVAIYLPIYQVGQGAIVQ